jgi:hypothetical protein
MTKILAHVRRSAIPYLALVLVLAVGLGGGYALAASKTKTITVCADKKTGILQTGVVSSSSSSFTAMLTRSTFATRAGNGWAEVCGPQ